MTAFEDYAAGVLRRYGATWEGVRLADGRAVVRFTVGPGTATIVAGRGRPSLRAAILAAFTDRDQADALRTVLGPYCFEELARGGYDHAET